jgi:hypothetical protein
MYNILIKQKEKVMTNQKINIAKISDDELIDMFEPIYEEQIASRNNIGSYECNCRRDSSSPDVRVEVMVVGLAGSPTMDDYKNGKVKDSSKVVVDLAARGKIVFKLVPGEITALNTNDYVAVYKVA